MFGAIFYRLFRTSPLTDEFSDQLVRQEFRGARARAGEVTASSKPRRVRTDVIFRGTIKSTLPIASATSARRPS
jgi:hypothetical protein